MKIIEWHNQIPVEARVKLNHYLGMFPTDETLDLLNEASDTMESAIFRCLPDESGLKEPFEYWYNIINNPVH